MARIFAANWKLNKSPREAREFLEGLKNQVPSGAEVLIFPSAPCWEAVAPFLKGPSLGWGAQNIWQEAQGAFTGENSAAVLKELGGGFALVGHSERRQIFGEQNDLLNRKVRFLQSSGLVPVLCVGETLEQRERGETNSVLESQLSAGLKEVATASRMIVAYEPVWAIGTGRVAEPAQVHEAHKLIRGWLDGAGFKGSQILYGGSAKADNAGELGRIENVDGFLIGGASLDVASFVSLIKNGLGVSA